MDLIELGNCRKRGEKRCHGKRKKKIVLSELEPEERLKYEIAEELGLLDQVMEKGWKSLSSRETGRIGGIVKNRRKMFKNCEQSEAGVEK